MAIEKQINIVVKETGLDTVQKQVNSLDNSLEDLSSTQKSLASSMKGSTNSVLENGGAMGLLNDATGGLAMTVKDAVEASVLFTKSQKVATITQGIYTTVVGTSTGAMKAFRIALAATGIGAIVIALVALIANFDKVKKAVLNVVPGLAKVGEFISNIVDAVTDFVGITSDASRELDRLGKQANETLEKNKFFLDAYGDKYDEYTKRKIEANNKYAEQVKAINENEELGEAEKLRRLKLLRERADREILDATNDREEELAKKRKEAQDKIDEENKKRAEAEKARLEKLAEERKKRQEEELKEFNEFQINVNNAQFEQRAIDKQNFEDNLKDLTDASDAFYDAQQDTSKKSSAEQIALDNSVKDAKVDIANQTLNLIAEIAGKGSKVGKAVAIAQATLSGVQGVQNAFTTASASPITTVFPAYPFIQAGLAGAFSAVQIAKLAKGEKASGGSSGGGGSAGVQSPSAPSFNLVQGTGTNQIAQGLANQTQPLKAYVVGSDVTNQQQLDRNIVQGATLGG